MPEMRKAYLTQELTTSQQDMVRTLLYFDIFRYPLTKEEIKRFMPSMYNLSFDNQFEEMLNAKYIHPVGHDLYAIRADDLIAPRRLAGNQRAEQKMKTARKMSRIISRFPFVRCVMLSGSISKGFMLEDSDIDFFIITAPNRLWISRMMLVLFKRLFLFNSKKLFCVNYFIDSDSLEIEEKNLFTAIESATLIPTYNKEAYQHYWKSNEWVAGYLPNARIRSTDTIPKERKSLLKSFFEMTLSNRLGDLIDRAFMKMTLNHWKATYSGDLRNQDFEIAFKTRRNVSKSHPQFYQKKVLDELDIRIEKFEKYHEVKLQHQ